MLPTLTIFIISTQSKQSAAITDEINIKHIIRITTFSLDYLANFLGKYITGLHHIHHIKLSAFTKKIIMFAIQQKPVTAIITTHYVLPIKRNIFTIRLPRDLEPANNFVLWSLITGARGTLYSIEFSQPVRGV